MTDNTCFSHGLLGRSATEIVETRVDGERLIVIRKPVKSAFEGLIDPHLNGVSRGGVFEFHISRTLADQYQGFTRVDWYLVFSV